jgi:hypothetical protein
VQSQHVTKKRNFLSNNSTLQSGRWRLFDLSPIEPEPTFGRLLWLGGESSTGLPVGANGIGEGGGAVEKFSVSLAPATMAAFTTQT